MKDGNFNKKEEFKNLIDKLIEKPIIEGNWDYGGIRYTNIKFNHDDWNSGLLFMINTLSTYLDKTKDIMIIAPPVVNAILSFDGFRPFPTHISKYLNKPDKLIIYEGNKNDENYFGNSIIININNVPSF